MKTICVICSLNSSRSQAIEEFLHKKYNLNSNIKITSAGLDVYKMREDDKRVLFTEQMARGSSLILSSDSDKFYRIKYHLLKNEEEQIKKVHLLRIPDVFYPHKNVYMAGKNGSYEEHMQKLEQEPEYKKLIEYVNALNPEEASALTEALYIKETYNIYSSNKNENKKNYPFELLYKTLEFRLPEISKLIENIK